MLIKTQKLLKSNRMCVAMTGLSVIEFNRLLPAFKQAALGYRSELTPKRKRKIGGGRSGKLPSWEDKLVFILVYLKHYPTYDLMGFLFDRDRTKCCRSVHFLLPVMERAMGHTANLPKKRISSVEEFLQICPELKDVFIDGTE